MLFRAWDLDVVRSFNLGHKSRQKSNPIFISHQTEEAEATAGATEADTVRALVVVIGTRRYRDLNPDNKSTLLVCGR